MPDERYMRHLEDEVTALQHGLVADSLELGARLISMVDEIPSNPEAVAAILAMAEIVQVRCESFHAARANLRAYREFSRLHA